MNGRTHETPHPVAAYILGWFELKDTAYLANIKCKHQIPLIFCSTILEKHFLKSTVESRSTRKRKRARPGLMFVLIDFRIFTSETTYR